MDFLFSFKFLKIALLSAVLFILLDFLWLAVIASPWYRNALGYLSQLSAEGKITFNIPAGLIAQLAISFTLSFVIMLSLQVDNRLVTAMLVGGFIGLAFYACYDFTNLSFVKDWPLWISLIDMAWGTLQGVIGGVVVYFLANILK
jgi:uncharacterized membrane protein